MVAILTCQHYKFRLEQGLSRNRSFQIECKQSVKTRSKKIKWSEKKNNLSFCTINILPLMELGLQGRAEPIPSLSTDILPKPSAFIIVGM